MKTIIAATLTLMFATTLIAQSKPAKPRFSSVYSNFTTDCKSWAGEGGTDGYSICRGPGRYQIRNYFAAAAAIYNAELRGDDGQGYPLTMVALDFDDRKTKVEWRMANGNPFAVIMRIPTYAAPTKDTDYWGPVNGAKLIIRGLKGFDIDEEVDAKLPDSNARAREIADAAYRRIKGT